MKLSEVSRPFREREEALRSLVEALPKCYSCKRPATFFVPQSPDFDTGERDAPMPFCDEHKGTGCGRRGCCDPEEVEYAEALRNAMKLLEKEARSSG